MGIPADGADLPAPHAEGRVMMAQLLVCIVSRSLETPGPRPACGEPALRERPAIRGWVVDLGFMVSAHVLGFDMRLLLGFGVWGRLFRVSGFGVGFGFGHPAPGVCGGGRSMHGREHTDLRPDC